MRSGRESNSRWRFLFETHERIARVKPEESESLVWWMEQYFHRKVTTQAYKISREGLQAITDHLENEREADAKFFDSPALFLLAATVTNSEARLAPRMINEIWNEVCAKAGVQGKTPHSARHAGREKSP